MQKDAKWRKYPAVIPSPDIDIMSTYTPISGPPILDTPILSIIVSVEINQLSIAFLRNSNTWALFYR